MISLGCAKNLVDAEIMLGNLMKEGFEIINDAEQADVMIVNTCSFIDSAQEESVDTILESSEVREASNRGQGLIVSGCLSQRYREELPNLIPEVDVFMGIDQVNQIGEKVHEAMAHREKRLDGEAKLEKQGLGREEITDILNGSSSPGELSDHEKEESIRGTDSFGKTKQALDPGLAIPPLIDVTQRPDYIPDFVTPRFRLTPRHLAYLKIAEGCNHPCSFCIIPRMRGSHRSRQQSDIVAEAKALIADGVKEINLISQDSTYYGMDLRENHKRTISSPEKFTAAADALPENATTLSSLLRELNSLEGDFWIRLLYTHPAHWTDELIQTISECPKVARYVDIPLQHIHQTMLERMRRETTQQYIVDLIKKIREGVPGIAIRTTFIVGFPGENEEYFETLLAFLRDTRFERMGVFTYSHEDGTKAAKMEQQLTVEEKNQRRDRAMAVQLEISNELAAAQVGKIVRVLVEKEASENELIEAAVQSWEHGHMRKELDLTDVPIDGYMLCRGEVDAPDIDGRIYVKGELPLGEFIDVKIVGHTDYDLIAEPV
ncbi:30S ribosomal protein S12 methylthiotransferase RimO [Verrucomicrobia bacterium]|nr:30S ribosomal protein S12 methylthiotransferase RimO [Verrucomicrobiota bacterium]